VTLLESLPLDPDEELLDELDGLLAEVVGLLVLFTIAAAEVLLVEVW
jgi:hypothetical protein